MRREACAAPGERRRCDRANGRTPPVRPRPSENAAGASVPGGERRGGSVPGGERRIGTRWERSSWGDGAGPSHPAMPGLEASCTGTPHRLPRRTHVAWTTFDPSPRCMTGPLRSLPWQRFGSESAQFAMRIREQLLIWLAVISEPWPMGHVGRELRVAYATCFGPEVVRGWAGSVRDASTASPQISGWAEVVPCSGAITWSRPAGISDDHLSSVIAGAPSMPVPSLFDRLVLAQTGLAARRHVVAHQRAQDGGHDLDQE